MKPFEEQYTAWIDGRPPEGAQAELESHLAEDRAAAEADRTQARQLSALLRRQYDAVAAAPPLKNAEFFNQSLLRQIEAESAQRIPPHPLPIWPFWRMIWGGLGSLSAATVLFAALVLPTLNRPGPPPEYYAQILKAQTSDPAISAVAIHSKKENVTILWIEGLDYVPSKAKD